MAQTFSYRTALSFCLLWNSSINRNSLLSLWSVFYLSFLTIRFRLFREFLLWQSRKNPTRNCEVVGLVPGLDQWVKDSALSWACGVGHRCSLDPAWLWLAVVAPIWPLAREPPYAEESGPRKGRKTKRKKKDNLFILLFIFIMWCYFILVIFNNMYTTL